MANIKSIGGNPIVPEQAGGALRAEIDQLWKFGMYLDRDELTGRYANDSISRWLSTKNDGKTYGVSIPKGSTTDCTKTGANASVANPVPGYVGTPAQDPYVLIGGPFRHYDVNGGVDADGTPYVTAFEWDVEFARDGSNGNVWVLTPMLYWAMDESGETAVTLSVSDSKLSGMAAQPQAYLPDGSLRPYMLYAKYIGSNDGEGNMVSVSDAKPWNRNISHNTLITACDNATTGYSGKSIADDWYLKVMFLLKYATKNSQSVFYGANNYNYQYSPAVAEEGVTRVILTNAQAANLVVGSAMMLGTHTGDSPGNDRNTGVNFDVFDGVRILSITDYDADNKAINFDTSTTFDTATTYLLSTSPWWAGSLDAVEGDGTFTSAGASSGHEPFVLQGIETAMGLNELLGDVILNSDGSTGWEPCICYDSRNETTSVSANYTHTGKYLPSGASDAYHYPLYPTDASGLLIGAGDTGSTSVGMCDGQYTSKTATSGTREWCGLGRLSYGADAGLWCVAGGALPRGFWSLGSRLSGTGRSRAAA